MASISGCCVPKCWDSDFPPFKDRYKTHSIRPVVHLVVLLQNATRLDPMRTNDSECRKLEASKFDIRFEGSDHTGVGRQFPACTETCSASQRLSNRSLRHLELLYLLPRKKKRTCMSLLFMASICVHSCSECGYVV